MLITSPQGNTGAPQPRRLPRVPKQPSSSGITPLPFSTPRYCKTHVFCSWLEDIHVGQAGGEGKKARGTFFGGQILLGATQDMPLGRSSLVELIQLTCKSHISLWVRSPRPSANQPGEETRVSTQPSHGSHTSWTAGGRRESVGAQNDNSLFLVGSPTFNLIIFIQL